MTNLPNKSSIYSIKSVLQDWKAVLEMRRNIIYCIKLRQEVLTMKRSGRVAAAIYFGVHTANAVLIARRRQKNQAQANKAA